MKATLKGLDLSPFFKIMYNLLLDDSRLLLQAREDQRVMPDSWFWTSS